ncbi:unnamed protein product [Larinioides sclopetarius]|uniref:RanBP2-type domain-containing protein n=1 Tax=Larinioides sclopetarius TaxID=280406 RepID=A0AAV2AN42_9ARAC
MKPPTSILQPMSTSTPYITLLSPSTQTSLSTMSMSTPVISQSTSRSCLDDLSGPSQQLTAIPTINDDAATNLSVFTGISETPEAHDFEHFKLNCEIAACPVTDGDEGWDFLDDLKPVIPQSPEESLYSGDDEEISGDAEEWEVLDDFNRLTPLPVEIALETGKYEKVMFEDQANLYKYVEQEWKEQHLCIVKIFYNEFNGRVRLLMKREEVLEACANHYITPHLELHHLENLDHAWAWVAEEFVNEELKLEHFCIRFKDAALAAAFKVAFTKAAYISYGAMTDDLTSSICEGTDLLALSEEIELEFASKATWRCRFCRANNGSDKHFCFICKASKPCWCKTSSKVPKTHTCDRYSPIGYQFTSAETWCCHLCETTNEADKFFCVICETSKPSL